MNNCCESSHDYSSKSTSSIFPCSYKSNVKNHEIRSQNYFSKHDIESLSILLKMTTDNLCSSSLGLHTSLVESNPFRLFCLVCFRNLLERRFTRHYLSSSIFFDMRLFLDWRIAQLSKYVLDIFYIICDSWSVSWLKLMFLDVEFICIQKKMKVRYSSEDKTRRNESVMRSSR